MIACICGGVFEIGAFAIVMASIHFGTTLYNHIMCKRHKCKHNCKTR